MSVTLDFDEALTRELADLARGRGLSVEEYLHREVEELVARQRRFRETAGHILEKNAELYRRLAQ